MAEASKSNIADNNNDLPLLAHLIDKNTLEAIKQVDHCNYERSKLIGKGQAAHEGKQWLPIDRLNEDKSTDFRTNYKPTHFKTDYKPTHFRTHDGSTNSNTPITLNKKKYFPQNSPISSTEYIGNSTDVIRHSSSHIIISTDGTNFSSTDSFAHSTENFKSSDNILKYLISYPDFQRILPIQLQLILAAILSGLLIVGSVAGVNLR